MAVQPEDIKKLRLAAGMTQEEFGKAFGMNRVTVSRMENGEAPIELRTFIAAQAATAAERARRLMVADATELRRQGVEDQAKAIEAALGWLSSDSTDEVLIYRLAMALAAAHKRLAEIS